MLTAGRPAAHRRTPLDGAVAAVRFEPRAARAGALARRSGGHRVALGNQLRSTLEAFWPGAACIFCRHHFAHRRWRSSSAIPRPCSAARLSEAALKRFCRSQHYSGRRSPAELLARLNSAATGLAGPLTNEAAGQLVRSMVAVLAASGRADRRAHAPHRALRRVAARRADHHVLPAGRPRLCRADPGRVGRRARALPRARPTGLRSRRRAGDLPVRQDPQRGLPLGLQPPPAPGHHLPGRQLASRQRVGPRHLQRCASPRLRSPACNSHPRPRLAARDLARWTDRTPYDPGVTSALSSSLPAGEVDPGGSCGLPGRHRIEPHDASHARGQQRIVGCGDQGLAARRAP